MNIQRLFSTNLKRIRENKEISQEKLAELCESSQNYISQIENENRFPSSAMLEKLCIALDILPDQLFVVDDDEYESRKKVELQEEIVDLLKSDLKSIMAKYKIT